ncbi:MAG: HD domain-containing protein [Anaerolineae bacterium]|nr:HD domain-containing protein [Anaerolineae bacterium]
MKDYSSYAGLWVALGETGQVVAAATQPEEARLTGRRLRPKEHLRLTWISPQPPYLPLPEWPLVPLRRLLNPDDIWFVGGAVRDLLLGRPVHDWDFAVCTPAMKAARCVADALGGAYVTLDSDHDTARVVLDDPATRQPVALDFAGLRGHTLEDDLMGRDFTLNAIALSFNGSLCDPTGGRRDLENGLIRVASHTTFADDPARLLRAIRLAGELGFRIETDTLVLLQHHAAEIHSVAAERVRAEAMKILQLPNATASLRFAEQVGVLKPVLEEISVLQNTLQSQPHYYAKVFDHTMATVAAVEGLLAVLHGHPRPRHVDRQTLAPSKAWDLVSETLHPHQSALVTYLDTAVAVEMPRAALLKWGALFHDAGKAQTRTVDSEGRTHFYGHEETGAQLTRDRLEALRFPNKARDFVATLVAEHMRPVSLSQAPAVTRRATYRFFRDAGDAGPAVILLALADAFAVWGSKLTQERCRKLCHVASTLLSGYFDQAETVVAPPPLLSGYDLLALGLPPGPRIGRALEELREMQAAGEITNREEALAQAKRSLSPE